MLDPDLWNSQNLYHNLLWNVSSLDEIDAAYYPEVTESAGTLAYNRTYVVHADPNNLSDRSSLRPHVTQNYKDTFYVTTVTGYEHDSYILEDMACIPYGSEKSDIPLIGRFGSRFSITVEVINPSTGSTIETMSSEFLNWWWSWIIRLKCNLLKRITKDRLLLFASLYFFL